MVNPAIDNEQRICIQRIYGHWENGNERSIAIQIWISLKLDIKNPKLRNQVSTDKISTAWTNQGKLIQSATFVNYHEEQGDSHDACNIKQNKVAG